MGFPGPKGAAVSALNSLDSFSLKKNYTIKCEYSHCIAKMQTVTS